MIDLERPKVYIYERNRNVYGVLAQGLADEIKAIAVSNYNPHEAEHSLFLLSQKIVFLINASTILAVEDEQRQEIALIRKTAESIGAPVIEYEILGTDEDSQSFEIKSASDLDELFRRVRQVIEK